jgi:prefoldin subunit 4
LTLQLDDDDSNDVEVTWTDQEKINQFSRLNTRQTEAEQLLESKRQEKEQVDEVYEEIELLELNEDDDDLDVDEDDETVAEDKIKSDEKIAGGRSLPFKIGDAFVYVTLEKGVKLLDQERIRLEKEIAQYEEEIAQCEKGMKGLKVDLYAKFGSNISECEVIITTAVQWELIISVV